MTQIKSIAVNEIGNYDYLKIETNISKNNRIENWNRTVILKQQCTHKQNKLKYALN